MNLLANPKVSFLFRQGERELKAALNPFAKLFGGGEPRSSDVDHAAHWLASEIHLPCILFLERGFITCESDAHHQIIAYNPATHMPPDHEGQSSEHLALDDIGTV